MPKSEEAKREDAVLKRMLNTPPKSHTRKTAKKLKRNAPKISGKKKVTGD